MDIILSPKRLRSVRGNSRKAKRSRKGLEAVKREPEDYISCRRREELASVLRRVRAGVRIMDSAMPEDEVSGLIQEYILPIHNAGKHVTSMLGFPHFPACVLFALPHRTLCMIRAKPELTIQNGPGALHG